MNVTYEGLFKYIANPINAIGARNRQARFIAGVDSNFESDEELVATAIKHLNNFAFVGISDDLYNSSVALFEFMIDKRVPQVKSVLKSYDGKKIFNITKEAYDTIIEANQADWILYRYARRMFFRRYNAMRNCSRFIKYNIAINPKPPFEWDEPDELEF